MFLAKKRIAIAYEDGIKEGRKEQAELEAKVAELTAIKKRLQEELCLLRATRSTSGPSA